MNNINNIIYSIINYTNIFFKKKKESITNNNTNNTNNIKDTNIKK